jgi:hypothetical protein
VSKRRSARSRARRTQPRVPPRPQRAPEASERAEREARDLRDFGERRPRGPRPSARPGVTRATGAPSAGLERAAAWERTYVVKDFRRLGIVIAAMLALLAASGIAVNQLVR